MGLTPGELVGCAGPGPSPEGLVHGSVGGPNLRVKQLSGDADTGGPRTLPGNSGLVPTSSHCGGNRQRGDIPNCDLVIQAGLPSPTASASVVWCVCARGGSECDQEAPGGSWQPSTLPSRLPPPLPTDTALTPTLSLSGAGIYSFGPALHPLFPVIYVPCLLSPAWPPARPMLSLWVWPHQSLAWGAEPQACPQHLLPG